MPLPPSGPREELHIRQIEMRGYRRPDGLYEIDGRVNDRKTFPFISLTGEAEVAPGGFIHDMWLRLVVDEDLGVHDVYAATDASPHGVCREAPAAMKAIIGARIAGGWAREVKKRLGGTVACTHLMELLIPLGTAAYQTLSHVRRAKEQRDPTGRPYMLDSCYAYATDRDVVLQRWPDYYTGAKVIPIVDQS